MAAPVAKRPLAWVPGLVLPLYGSAITVSNYFATDFSSLATLCMLFPITYVLGMGSILLDHLMSPTLGDNLQILQRHGYPKWHVFGVMLLNLALSNGTTMVLAFLLCGGYTMRAPDLALVAKVLFNLAGSEVLFTVSHRLLHSKLPAIHALHHTCRRSSWSTNLTFHPVDLLMEFSGPVGFIALTHVALFRDPLATILSFSFLHLWYAWDHDETVRLPHYSHHLTIDSVYTIYVKYRDHRAGFDKVKQVIEAEARSH